MLKLRDWIDINKIDWHWLSLNSNAISLLEENKNKINWVEIIFKSKCNRIIKKKSR